MIALASWAVGESLLNDSAPHPPIRAAMAAVSLLSIAVRRFVPMFAVALFAFGMAAESLILEAPDEVAVLLGLAVLSFSVCTYKPVREALVGAVILSLSLAVAIAVDPSDNNANIIPSMFLFVVLPGALGVTVYRRQQGIVELTREAEQKTREAAVAVDVERRRIARELHDVVSHAVTLIAIQAEAGQAVFELEPEQARGALHAIGDVSREALTELDRLLKLLRADVSGPVEDVGLHRLSALVEGTRAAGLGVTVSQTGTSRSLPPEVDHCAYRVIQEGLTNALRYSSGATVSIVITYEVGCLRLEIDSIGLQHRSGYGGSGRGLAGLRERVTDLGGKLESDLGPGGHFGVKAMIPTVVE